MLILQINVFIITLVFSFFYTDADGVWLNRRLGLSRQSALTLVLCCILFCTLGYKRGLIFLIKTTLDIFLLNYLTKKNYPLFVIYQITLVVICKYFLFDTLTLLENFGLGYQMLSVILFAKSASMKKKLSFREFFNRLKISMLPSYYLAGPIEHFEKLDFQFNNPAKINFQYSTALIFSGLLKISLKSFLGSYGLNLGSLQAIISISIYFYLEISAYSDIIRGITNGLGFQLTDNFNIPFAKTSVSEMWKSWHISLNNWFLEFVFQPLAFKLKTRSAKLNYTLCLYITFILIGLWHKISLNYIFWSIAAATIVLCEQNLPKIIKAAPLNKYFDILKIIYVFIIMGILRYITFIPNLNFKSIVSEVLKFQSVRFFNFSTSEDFLILIILILIILSVISLDYILINRSKYFENWIFFFIFITICSFAMINMYNPESSVFSYGQI